MLSLFGSFLLLSVLTTIRPSSSTSFSPISVDPKSRAFVDESNRVRIFRGVNAVYKIAPWLPTSDGFDPLNSLSSVDAQLIRSWGFNVVRLGVMWPGVEPGARGDFNTTYLEETQKIVEILGEEGISVILDFHQDIWHREYCGEGVPDYIYQACLDSYPEDTPAFPLPSVNATYPEDETGVPELSSCLSVMFATYYMSAEVGAGFQCLYDNKAGTWDALSGYWTQVAKTFSASPNVLGYELINEPWAGNTYDEKKNLLPQVTEKKYLQPLYEHLHRAIRQVDESKIIFFEGLTIDYWPNGFTEGPGGSEYNDRQALAYHIYCPVQDPTVKSEAACTKINDKFFQLRKDDAERIGCGMIMTEFGAAEDIKGDIYALEKTTELADQFAQSWMYWQYKYYNDITTCTPEGEALFYGNGTVVEHKLRVLSRTYPQATAGDLHSFSFNRINADFLMAYSLLDSSRFLSSTTAKDTEEGRTTEVYYNREYFYPYGVNVELTWSAESANVPSTPPPLVVNCVEGNYIHLVQTAATADGESSLVNVVMTSCSPLAHAACTCR